jgi:glycosyltransferase involved in cell wall biosynthesis
MPEIIRDGENGFLFDRDPAELAAKISRLLTDDALHERIGQAGRQAALPFEAEKVIAAYADGYKAIIAAHRRPG